MSDARREDELVPMTRGEWRRWRERATVAFVVLTLASTFAVWLGYAAGRDATRGLRINSEEAVRRNCAAGGDLRIAVANGFDDLRTLALTAQVPTSVRVQFIERTQPVIDKLLSDAAGIPFHAPLPPGTVTDAVSEHVAKLSAERCRRRVAETFSGP